MKLAIVGSTSLTADQKSVKYIIDWFLENALRRLREHKHTAPNSHSAALDFLRTWDKEKGKLVYHPAEHISGQKLMIISGGAKGVDKTAATLADARGLDVIEYVPAVQAWRRGKPDGFEARNKKIAEECDALICIRDKKSRTYGSGWTRDYAESLGKPTWSYVIDTDDESMYAYTHEDDPTKRTKPKRKRAKETA